MSDVLPKYAFLPWLRQGIANQINQVDNLGNGSNTIHPVNGSQVLERINIDLKVKIKGNGNEVSVLNTDVKLVGPGDIIGINPNAIIKTEPLNWITNFEPNYFPYVEFYDEDFPWRYTPASPTTSHKLRPWFTLVVLKEEEYTKQVSMEGTLPSIKLDDSFDPNTGSIPFPPQNETWAWSHVHINGDLYTDEATPLNPSNQTHVDAGVTRMSELIAQNPDIAISRMMCPRELDPNTDYYAFLVPSFETGRMAGLGADPTDIALVDAQLPSWGTAGSHVFKPKEWPVYHEWYFKTGAAGDFEYLVRQIVPRVLDNRVGKRPMDIQNPGYLLEHSDPTINGALQLEGALRIPGNAGEPFPWAPSEVIAVDFRSDLKDLVNLGQNILDNTLGSAANIAAYSHLGLGSNVQDDPIIAPPLYGRWHALKKTVSATGTGWVDELNIDPRNRAIAGIGTRVVQKNQDKLMDMAWEQVGEVIEANKKLKWAQASKEVSHAMFNRHIKSQPKEEKLQLMAKLHKKVKSTSGGTIFKQNKEAVLPVASGSRAFRKIRRTNGPLMKRLDPFKVIGNSAGASHITARMSDASGAINSAEAKVVAIKATSSPVSALENVIGYSSTLNTAGYNFKLTNPGELYSPAANTATAQSFQQAIEVFQNHFDAINWQTPAPLGTFDLQEASDDIDAKTDPRLTIPSRVYHAQKLEFSKPFTLPAPDKIVPILAAPSFKQPLYESIRDLSTDLLIPNLNLIPNNTISLLETNPKFIESFMVGVNHEMGRELLWREYPTDQRGTYFKHFWDATDFVDSTELLNAKQLEDKTGDIKPIHTWQSSSLLGSHDNRVESNGTTPEAKVVLAIRGDLLKKYPSAVIYAQKAEWQLKNDGNGNMVHDYAKSRRLKENSELYPIFGAKIEPDINFIGFDLDACEVRGDEIVDQNAAHNSYDPGYFFIIKERPGEVRFGADLANPSGDAIPNTWSELRWDHIQKVNGHIKLAGGTIIPDVNANIPATVDGLSVSWSATSTSADLAMATFQNPVLVAIHAKEMLNDQLVSAICP